jgi:glutathione S-transferase
VSGSSSSQPHLEAFAVKYKATLKTLEVEAPEISATPFGIGHIAIGCALSYADFRFADLNWRAEHSQIAAWHASFSQRPSARATEAVEG